MIELLLIRATHDEFGDGESQIVEFSPGLPYHGAFFFLTYQAGSCWNQ